MKQNCIHKQSKIRNSVATSYQQADVEPFVEKQEFITRDEKMTVPVKSKCPPLSPSFSQLLLLTLSCGLGDSSD